MIDFQSLPRLTYPAEMTAIGTIQAKCGQHVLHYPGWLDQDAIDGGHDRAFCAASERGIIHFVVVWLGDRARVMKTGDMALFDQFEETGWPESTAMDENGIFFYRSVPHPLAVGLFLDSLLC